MKYLFLFLLSLGLASTMFAARACDVSVTGLHFAGINPIAGKPYDSTATITVTCPSAASFTLSLSPGFGAYGQRIMQSAANTLRYGLYLDSAHTRLWGDGTAGTSIWRATAGAVDVSHTIFGLVPNQPRAVPGTYSDVITVTVTY